MLFAKTKGPAPVLNTPNFAATFAHPMPLCEKGHLRALEFVALPGAILLVVKEIDSLVLQVKAPDYPLEPLYVDRRFITLHEHRPSFLRPPLPSPKKIAEQLYERVGLPYIWGGNWACGIPELLDYYPPGAALTQHSAAQFTLRGLDCSGLLYEVMQGRTPRNTSELLSFGREVPESAPLQPLDLIVWKGHVVIVGRPGETIEARAGRGVVVTPLDARLKEISPGAFSIRRIALGREQWLPEEPCLH